MLAVAQQQVQIDLGSQAGVQPGDRARFLPIGAPPVTGRVETVEGRASWVRLDRAAPAVEPGVAVEVLLPPGRRQGAARDYGAGVPGTTPAWSRKDAPFDSARPLLAEDPLQPQERPSLWSGRVYLSADSVWEQEELDSQSTFGRMGLDLRGENPFGAGGRMHFALDLDLRSFSADGLASESDSAARVERLSYTHGGDRFHALRWQAGRFLQYGVPEFGVVDGAEVSYRVHSGDRFGGSFGLMPEPGQDYRTGDDLQVSAFYRWVADEDERLRLTAGAQKTWHDGSADRDLLLLKAEYLPSTSFRWRTSAWIDFYDAADVGKGDGPEVTLLHSNASWRWSDSGASVGFRQWRFPQLLRYQAGSFTNFELLNASTSRVDARWWTRFSGRQRLSLRADSWNSNADSGGGGEVRLDWPDLIASGLHSSAALFLRSGGFSEVTGVRLGQSYANDWGSWRLNWESANYTPVGGDTDLLEHDLRLSWNQGSAAGWSFGLDAGYRFGDQIDSPSLGFFLQRSF